MKDGDMKGDYFKAENKSALSHLAEKYGDRFYYDAPFYRAGMPAEEYRCEKLYLNENVDMFIGGTYVPLWRQRQRDRR